MNLHASPRCFYCDKPAVDRHHITGRGPDGSYLDADHTADLCHQHHELIHNILRSQGIDRPKPDATTIEVNAYLLHREAVFLAQYGLRQANTIWTKIAADLEASAQLLRDIANGDGE